MTEDALRKTWEHIDLVVRLLTSAQIELMKRAVTHDRSKLSSPEWKMFAEITHKLEGLTYGSEEYENQRKEMLNSALGHHYEHNRHHPEFFESRKPSNVINNHILTTQWAIKNGCIMPDDIFGYEQVENYLIQKQNEHQSSINNMNLFDILEMLIDWCAACKRHADGDIEKSIEINTKRFNLSPQLVNIIKNTVPCLEDKFKDLKTQKDIY